MACCLLTFLVLAVGAVSWPNSHESCPCLHIQRKEPKALQSAVVPDRMQEGVKIHMAGRPWSVATPHESF